MSDASIAAPADGPSEEHPTDRREFVTRASRLAMAAGLAGGYGAFGAVATRYLYPARPEAGSWQFVAELSRMRTGDTLLYRAPGGETVNITRRAEFGDADDFIALSSTCPHLGCQVHWEPQNARYFCPCHNGTFDPSGVGTGGPPGDAGQTLPRYPLRVDGGLLFIQVTLGGLFTATDGEILDADDCASAPGHDPCLSPLAARGRPRRT